MGSCHPFDASFRSTYFQRGWHCSMYQGQLVGAVDAYMLGYTSWGWWLAGTWLKSSYGLVTVSPAACVDIPEGPRLMIRVHVCYSLDLNTLPKAHIESCSHLCCHFSPIERRQQLYKLDPIRQILSHCSLDSEWNVGLQSPSLPLLLFPAMR